MTTSLTTKKYWISAAKDLMKARVMPPQYDEFCAVCDELLAAAQQTHPPDAAPEAARKARVKGQSARAGDA